MRDEPFSRDWTERRFSLLWRLVALRDAVVIATIVVVAILALGIAGCSAPAAANNTSAPAATPTEFLHARGIPYVNEAGGVTDIIYDPVGDETEVRFAIQTDLVRTAPVLSDVVYRAPRDRLVCRLHNGNAIAHVTIIRDGGINNYAIPA